MRITIDIDEALLAEAQQLSGQRTKKATIEEALRLLVRGRVVAELGPPQAERNPFLADPMLAEAVRKGWMTPPAIVGQGPPPRGKPVMTLRELLLDLERDRADRDPTGRS